MASINGSTVNARLLMPNDRALALGRERLPTRVASLFRRFADRILVGRMAADEQGYFEPVGAAPGSSTPSWSASLLLRDPPT